MKTTRRNVLRVTTTLVAGGAALGWPSLGRAQALRWDMAEEYNETSMTAAADRAFIEALHERAGDEVEITLHTGAALGYRSVDHFDAVESGAVQIANTLATQLGGIDPFFDMSSLPFIVRSQDEARRLWELSRATYEEIFAGYGMVLLFSTPNPPSGIWANHPIDSPDALSGLRIRTYDVNGTTTMQRAGASPLQISWSDLVPALSTGAVESILTSANGGVLLSAWDYLTDFTELNYAQPLFMAHVNQYEYDTLSDDGRAAVAEASRIAEDFIWAEIAAQVAKDYEVMRENGIEITTDVPDAVFDHLEQAGGEVREGWLAKVGERGAVLDTLGGERS